MNQWPLQRDAMAFYGNPYAPGWLEANTTRVDCPWSLHMGAAVIKNILVHKKCAESLKVVLHNTWVALDQDFTKVKAWQLDEFDGSYNLRPKRGGTSLSMHGLAAALDWDAVNNAQHSQKHFFTHQTPLVVKFLEEGWVWGGDWSPGSIDAMHFQAARVHP